MCFSNAKCSGNTGIAKRIITEWLPSSGYVYANLPDIELYPNGDINAPDYTTEVWIPIQKPN